MRLAALLCISALAAGCAVKREEPQWLKEVSKVECSASVTPECISVLSKQLLEQSEHSPFAWRGTLFFVAAAELRNVPWQAPAAFEGAERNALSAYADAIKQIRTGTLDKALQAALKLDDPEAKSLALYFISIKGLSQNSGTTTPALEELARIDQDLYRMAMTSRLESLLHAGDLERAYALRKYIVRTASMSDPNLGPDLNDVALVYARTGMLGDLGDWVQRLPEKIVDLKVGDEEKLRTAMVNASLGKPPGVAELGSIKRQETRFTAYLELARLYRLLGNGIYEKKAIQDAALYGQMASMTLDRAIVVEYLSLMLVESKAL